MKLMDQRSEREMAFVHPDMIAVLRNASQTPQSFVVVYGLRSLKDEEAAVQSGHSKTIHSRHLPNPKANGQACAVDVAALLNGRVSFAPTQEKEIFGQIAKQIQASADALKIPIQWGGAEIGAWIPGKKSTFRDWGHFQLTWEAYP